MKKTSLSFYFIFISLFTLLTTLVLVIQKGYSKLIGPIQQSANNELIKPINPNLDLGIVSEIENRKEYIPGEDQKIYDNLSNSLSPTPSISTAAATPTVYQSQE